MNGYTHQVNFTKAFVAGLLAGKLYHDHLRFVSKADATKFAARQSQVIKAVCGGGDYRLEECTIINLADYA